MGSITEAAAGFPNSSGHIPFECGNIAEVLGERGWNTFMVGKWHLTPEDEMNMASTKRQWPLGRGFERFYGGAETNQWYPDLIHDNHPVEQPATPEEGYHFSTDITDHALTFIRDAKAVARTSRSSSTTARVRATRRTTPRRSGRTDTVGRST
jgi:arylsulfatase A-like enzyme